MVYQFSEKNQIFIALFAIVVLCAGKLFKDYLFRQGYIEGMSNFTTETSTQMRRSATSGSNVDAEVYLYFTLDKDLPSAGTITMASAITGSRVAFNSSVFTAIVESGTTTAILTPSGTVTAATFTSDKDISAGSRIKITITKIRISSGHDIETNTAASIKFTITPSNNESAASRDIKILPSIASGLAGDYTAPTTATSTEIQAAINGINSRLAVGGITAAESTSLLKARSALVTLLASTYGTIKEASQVFESGALYNAQQTAIDFIAKEKARAASNATTLKEDNSNKRRMAQVNTYYTRNYEANIDVMKNIIFVSVALILLAVLRNKDLLPPSISTLGVIFVLTLGGIVIGQQVFDIIRRNDHDFDKYDWNFNEKEYNDKNFIQQSSETTNLSDMGMGMAPCYGPGCCDVGTRWDSTAKKCMPGAGGSVSGTAAWTSAIQGSLNGSLAIRLTVPGGLVASTDTVIITLPSGLFTGTPALPSGSPFSINASPTVSAPLTFTKITSDVAANTETTITITGLSVSATANSASRTLKVKTSKDINTVGINITGIQ
jgi:hypothetical protein